MTVYDIVSKLNSAGIKVWVDDGQLKLKAPKGALTKALKDEIVANKSELIEFLPSVTTASDNQEAIPVVSREGVLALSYAQQRMWFLAQLEPGNTAYHIRTALEVTGDLDVNALQQSFNKLIERHESLRTTFSEINGVPSQEIHHNVEFCLSSRTLKEQPLANMFSEFVDEPFDLQSGPLFRAGLAAKNDNQYVLMIAMHHIISDGWSAAVMVRELSALYASTVSGVSDALPAVNIQYVDYAYWQKSWLSGEKEKSQLEYWTAQLADVPVLELPTDTVRPAVKRSVGSVVSFEITKDVVESAKRNAKQQNASLFMVLLSVFNAFLYRYTGQTDFAVGTPIANRANPQLEGTLGLFVNTLAIRAPVQGDKTFLDYVTRLSRTAMDAYDHQDIPFERIVDALGVSRDMSHTPVFQVMFVLQNTPGGTKVSLPGVTVEAISIDRNTSPMDITMTLVEEADGSLAGELEFSTDLYMRDTASQMCRHYVSFLESVMVNPNQPVSKVDYLSVEEKQILLGGFGSNSQSSSRKNYECNLTLDAWFEQSVLRYPNDVAITDADSFLTYEQLNCKANVLGRVLQEEGVTKGTYVGISLERSSNIVVAILAVLKAGATYVPVDPGNPKERIQFILDDARIDIVIVDEVSKTTLPLTGRKSIDVSMCCMSLEDGNLEQLHNVDDVAYVIYTSGTTGKPKGVEIPHANVDRLFYATESDFEFNNNDVWTMFHSYAFDFSVWEMWGALLFGGRLVIVPKVVAQAPSEFYRLLKDEGVTVLNQTPTAFTHLIKEDEAQCIDEGQSSVSALALRYVIFGGEALDFSALGNWVNRHGYNTPALINMYGITETTVHVTYHKVSEIDLVKKRSLIGRPIDDLSLYILDGDFQLVPPGVAGEMYVGGAGLARGYLHRPELTNERFIPFSAAMNDQGFSNNLTDITRTTRLYKTGDVARYVRDTKNDGLIEYLGRADDQVKIRGYRIELGEIESTLTSHINVSGSVAAIFSDANKQDHIVAYVTVIGSVDAGDLKAYLFQHIPEYMVPTQIVLLEHFPLTSNGKVDKKRLPIPDFCEAAIDNFVAPSTDDEMQVFTIWKDVLGIDVISVNANFFEIGGHSLLATQVVSRIRKVFNLEISLKTLFESPTIRLLSLSVGEAREFQSGIDCPPVIVPQLSDDKKVLSFSQHRLWFVDQLDSDTSAYNLPVVLLLRGNIRADALEQAFRIILKRHSVLCTQYVEREGEPSTRYKDPSSWIMERESVTIDGDDIDHNVHINRAIEAHAEKHFDLANDWLFIAKLLDCGKSDGTSCTEDRHVLLLNMHHIVSDGWSMGVLVNELKILLARTDKDAVLLSSGIIEKAKSLPELPIQYEDYAAWQREWLSGDNLEHLKRYWIDTLDAAPAILRLPTDFPRPEKPTFNGAHLDINLGVETSKKLTEYCAENAVTPFMVLMSAYQILLGRYTHQEDICVGIPIANRNQYEIEGLIGFFVNGMIIRGRQQGNPTRQAFVESIKEASLGAFVHQDMPMDVLVDTLQMSGGGSYAPGAQVAFALQNMPNLESLSMPGLAVELLEREHKTAKYELTLLLEEREDSIAGVMEYNTDLFSVEMISLMAVHYQRVLEQLLENPNESISTITLASQSELKQVFNCDEIGVNLSPLSPMERDIYLDIVSEPTSLRNSIGSSGVFNQEFDVALCQKAFEHLVSQHPLMKAQVVSSEHPYLDVAYFKNDQNRTLAPKVYDYSADEWSDEAIAALVEKVVYRPYDLFNDDLYSFHLFELDKNRTLLVVAGCHIVADGAGMYNSFQDLFAIIDGLAKDESVEDLNDNVHEHVARSRQVFDSSKTLNYWREESLDVEALQFSMPIRSVEGGGGVEAETSAHRIEQTLSIESFEFEGIKQYCSNLGIHPAAYFKALYLLMLHYYCRPQSDFYFNEIVGGRSKKFRHTFGCFFQTLPTIVPNDLLVKDNSFDDVIAFLQSYKMSARRYDKVSQLAQRSLLPRGEQDFLYNYYNFIAEVTRNKETVTLLPHPQIQDGPVQFIVQEYDSTFLLQFVFNDGTFSSLEFLERLQHLSKQVLRGATSLHTLDFLLPSEVEVLEETAVLEESNVADSVLPTIVDEIVTQCKTTPHAVALKHADTSLCYADLDKQSRQWAGFFASKKVGKGDRVVVCLNPGLTLYPVLLGVLRVGAVYVPIDAAYPVERINYIVEDSRASLVVTERGVNLGDGATANKCCYSEKVVRIDSVVEETLQFFNFDSSSYHPTPESMMYVIYTSGSTGKPKGAGVYHRGVSNLLHWYSDSLNITNNDACLLMSSIGFDLTQKNPWAVFCSGARLVIPEMDQYDPDVIATTLASESITWLNCAPSTFYPLVEEGDLEGYPFKKLRHVVLGGESIRLPAIEQWLRTDHGNVTLINSYGPTECTDVVASYTYSPDSSIDLPIGKAIPNVELYIVDECNRRLAPGLVGELCVAGEAVGAGYLANSELTDLAFINNPFGDGLLYKTGDLARLIPATGQIYYVGRKDFQVKIRGLRIELGEIEFAVRQLDAVLDSLALVDGDSIVAYALLGSSSLGIDEKTIVADLHRSLPDFMVPNHIVILDKWPLTPNGKVDRKRLPKPVAQNEQDYVAPKTDTEIRLANIWCDVLNVEKVGVFDNFFDLGGHSLLAARVISKLRKEFSVEISLRVLFEMRTVSDIARYIDRLNWAVQSQTHGDSFGGLAASDQKAGGSDEVGSFDDLESVSDSGGDSGSDPSADGQTEEGFL